MKNNTRLKRAYRTIRFFGLDPYNLFINLKGLPKYYSDLNKLKKQKGRNSAFPFSKKFPILNEWSDQAGTASGHYFHQDLFVAQKVFKNNPKRHIDIGSRIDGFVAHVASFRKIEVLDIRALNSNIDNIVFEQADLMNVPQHLIDACDSISSLHAIEHFGLGRYNDPIDYFGYEKALTSINLMLKNGGKFYFSVPIGEQRIEFNAHRVFSVKFLSNLLSKHYRIDSFSFVDDAGDFHPYQSLNTEDICNNYGCKYGCGIFELTKL